VRAVAELEMGQVNAVESSRTSWARPSGEGNIFPVSGDQSFGTGGVLEAKFLHI
jgi:hypothetical protein